MCRAMAETDPTLTHHDLISWLCLEAGRMMEDISGELAMSLATGTVAVELRLDLLRQASADIVAYSAAADALHRRAGERDSLS